MFKLGQTFFGKEMYSFKNCVKYEYFEVQFLIFSIVTGQMYVTNGDAVAIE